MDLATYLINGRGEEGSVTAKKFLIENNKEFEDIIEILTKATIEYLKMQIKAGADVIKIFDSWAGSFKRRHGFKVFFKTYKNYSKNN